MLEVTDGEEPVARVVPGRERMSQGSAPHACGPPSRRRSAVPCARPERSPIAGSAGRRGTTEKPGRVSKSPSVGNARVAGASARLRRLDEAVHLFPAPEPSDVNEACLFEVLPYLAEGVGSAAAREDEHIDGEEGALLR